jgi:hypothetical protein
MMAQSKPQSETKPTYKGAEIKFEKMVVDFGNLKMGDVKTSTITFTNIGIKPLILDDVVSSCDCTEVEWPKNPIMPGQSATIVAKYTAKSAGPINKWITVLSNAETDRVILKTKGNVTSGE